MCDERPHPTTPINSLHQHAVAVEDHPLEGAPGTISTVPEISCRACGGRHVAPGLDAALRAIVCPVSPKAGRSSAKHGAPILADAGHSGRRQIWLPAISAALFATALTQPGFLWGQRTLAPAPAWRLLLYGWQAVAHGYIEWLANPALLASWVLALVGRRSPSLGAAGIALALMLVFLSRRTLELPAGPAALAYGAGYWLWLGSALLMLLGPTSLLPREPA